jgi:hypothetical protein
VSTFAGTGFVEHVLKAGKMILAFVFMIFLPLFVRRSGALSARGVLGALLVSASVSSLFCLLQGRFHLFLDLVPQLDGKVESWSRFTGLAEHPIESGMGSAYGIILALGLARGAGSSARRMGCYVLALLNLAAMQYSGSLTALIGLGAALAVYAVSARAVKLLLVGGMIAFLAGGVVLASGVQTPIVSRVQELIERKGDYATLQSREQQVGTAISLIGPATLLIGNGFHGGGQVMGGEIHNGFVATLYHLGVWGFLGQLLFLIHFLLKGLRKGEGGQEWRAVLLACLVIFMAGYASGPTLFRRSIWVPLFVLAAEISTIPVQKPRGVLPRGAALKKESGV